MNTTMPFGNIFPKPSEFLYCLEPLLKSLNFNGLQSNIRELLPKNKDSLSLCDFLNILADLNYPTKLLKANADKIPTKHFCAYFYQRENQH